MENLVYNIYMYIMYIWAFSHIAPLPERVAQNFDFYAWRNLLVEYVVDSIEDGHVDMIALVEQLHAVGAVVAFSYHLHLELSSLDAISLTYHRTEDSVAGEVGVHRHEQVAQIG